MKLRALVAAFQVAPKYNICIGNDNADLLLGLILDRLSATIEDVVDPECEEAILIAINHLKGDI